MSGPSSSSLSSDSDDSSIIDTNNQCKYVENYKKVQNKINDLIKAGKKEQNKIFEKKKNSNTNVENSFITTKKIEKKNKKMAKISKESDKQANEKQNPNKKCLICNKIIKKKNYYYHDGIVHDGQNISMRDRRKALNFYISKKLKKINLIYSNIMLKAKKLKIDSTDDPEFAHVKKIGFHIMKFKEKRQRK